MLRVFTLAVAVCLMPTQEALEDWPLFPLESEPSQPSRTLLASIPVGSWMEAPLESQMEYCKCPGFSSVVGSTASVSGREYYRTKLQDALPPPTESGSVLDLAFDESRDLGFDSGPQARPTIKQHLTQADGAIRFCGASSKAAVFKEENSQLKLPTPIAIKDGVYTISTWVLWPPAADEPSNPQGMRALVSGFGGDLQIAMNNESELGLSIIAFQENSTDGHVTLMDQLSSSRRLQEYAGGPTVRHLNEQDEAAIYPLGESDTGGSANQTAAPHNQTVPCQLTEWTKWAACNQTCRATDNFVGVRNRTRQIIRQPLNGGAQCGVLSENQNCNIHLCPVDCVLTEWSAWGDCSKVCGVGRQNRTRNVRNESVGTGKCLQSLEEKRNCNDQICDCVGDSCQPPIYSSLPKCLYTSPHTNKTLIETPGQIDWCKQLVRAANQYKAAAVRYERGPPTIECDNSCMAHKERTTKLEHGQGTDELLHKSGDYQRQMRERQMESKAKRLVTLRLIRNNHSEQASQIENELIALAGRHANITQQLNSLSQAGDQIPADLLLENTTIQSESANLTAVLNETLAEKQLVQDQIQNLANSTINYPSAKLPLPPSPETQRVPLIVPTFKSSGFNMSWLTPGWHQLAAVADGSATKFYIDSQEVGTVQAVSKTDLYSVGNYQGGGFQWGAIDNFKVYKKALAVSELEENMGCFTPLSASGEVSTSSIKTGCTLPGLNFWNRAEAWCADLSGTGSTWIQLTFATDQVVTAVMTVGDSHSARNGFVSAFELYYSSDGANFTRYNKGVLKGNTDQDTPQLTRLQPPMKGSHFRLGLVKWHDEAAIRWELYGCIAPDTQADTQSGLDEIVVKSTIGSGTVVASCGKGYAVTGGGCSALNPPYIVLSSAPSGGSAWKCEGRGSIKTMAICTTTALTVGNLIKTSSGTSSEFMKVFASDTGDQAFVMASSDGASVATCPQGYIMIGGGCGVTQTDVFAMQYSFPISKTSWMCGGNITYRPGMVSAGSISTQSSVLCSAQEAFHTAQIAKKGSVDDWVTVKCPNNSTLISGGCHAQGSRGKGTFFQYNGPDGKDQWTCGGHGFAKVVYGVCVNVSLVSQNQTARIVGSRGKTMHNQISPSGCQCPKRCKCPTRNVVGYVTDPTIGDGDAPGFNHTFASAAFVAHTAFAVHSHKIPSCICPPREPADIRLEFKMQVPSDLPKFEHELQRSIALAGESPGQTCGCGLNITKCNCRISIDKVTQKQGSSTMWQWRGKHERWHNLRDDKMFVHLHVSTTPLVDISQSWYHDNMSAVSIAGRIVAAITDPTSELRRNWFFMHITHASIINRILSQCELQMSAWSYRDAAPNNKQLNDGPGMWTQLNNGFHQCGNNTPQSPIALGEMKQVGQSYWDLNDTSTSSSSVTYSNSRNDKLQFDYGTNGTVELMNEGLFLSANFSDNLTFTEYGNNRIEHSFRGKVSGGTFSLKRAIFHLPAEHTIDGIRHPMEIQYEHENSKGELAIVSTLLKFGFQNEFLAKIFAGGIPMRCTAGVKQSNVQPAELFPFSSDYYAYSGSDTKPPCKPASYYVFKNPATVSLPQWIDVAQRLGTEKQHEEQCNRHGCKQSPIINDHNFMFSATLKGNVRPLQPLGGRIVRASRLPSNDQALDLTDFNMDLDVADLNMDFEI